MSKEFGVSQRKLSMSVVFVVAVVGVSVGVVVVVVVVVVIVVVVFVAVVVGNAESLFIEARKNWIKLQRPFSAAFGDRRRIQGWCHD